MGGRGSLVLPSSSALEQKDNGYVCTQGVQYLIHGSHPEGLGVQGLQPRGKGVYVCTYTLYGGSRGKEEVGIQ